MQVWHTILWKKAKILGCDIHLFTEGYLSRYPSKDKMWINIDHWYREDNYPQIRLTENEGFNYTNVIDHARDYGLFYLLAGVRGSETENSYPPISIPKGLPEQMDVLIKNNMISEVENFEADFHDASYLTLMELKKSGYGGLMPLRGWVYEDEYNEVIERLDQNQKCQLNFVDVKSMYEIQQDMVLKEWIGYINLNLTYMIERMEARKRELRIENDEDLRIVFWFDS